MRAVDTLPDLAQARRRYVTPGKRYLTLLGGNLVGLSRWRRSWFLRRLTWDAHRITDTELATLLDGGWRDRLVASWLIAVGRRPQFVDRVGALLLDSAAPHAGQGYLIALTSIGDTSCADWITRYLNRWLPHTEARHDQAAAMAALGRIDTALTRPFLAPGGLWEKWMDAGPTNGHLSLPDAEQDLGVLLASAGLSSPR